MSSIVALLDKTVIVCPLVAVLKYVIMQYSIIVLFIIVVVIVHPSDDDGDV